LSVLRIPESDRMDNACRQEKIQEGWGNRR
jgi:hypothetical protein